MGGMWRGVCEESMQMSEDGVEEKREKKRVRWFEAREFWDANARCQWADGNWQMAAGSRRVRRYPGTRPGIVLGDADTSRFLGTCNSAASFHKYKPIYAKWPSIILKLLAMDGGSRISLPAVAGGLGTSSYLEKTRPSRYLAPNRWACPPVAADGKSRQKNRNLDRAGANDGHTPCLWACLCPVSIDSGPCAVASVHTSTPSALWGWAWRVPWTPGWYYAYYASSTDGLCTVSPIFPSLDSISRY